MNNSKRKLGLIIGSILLISLIYIGLRVTNTNTKPKGIDKEKIAISGMGYSEETESYSLEDVKEQSELVIYGETIDYYSYLPNPGDIASTQIVRVDECIYGDKKKGDVIKITRSGGYVLLQEFIDSFNEYDETEKESIINHYRLNTYSQEQLNTLYFAQLSYDDVEMSIGNKGVFFLEKCENDAFESGTYVRTGGYEGEYAELPDGSFKIPSLISYDEASEIVEELEKVDEGLMEPEDSKVLDGIESIEDIAIQYDEVVK